MESRELFGHQKAKSTVFGKPTWMLIKEQQAHLAQTPPEDELNEEEQTTGMFLTHLSRTKSLIDPNNYRVPSSQTPETDRRPHPQNHLPTQLPTAAFQPGPLSDPPSPARASSPELPSTSSSRQASRTSKSAANRPSQPAQPSKKASTSTRPSQARAPSTRNQPRRGAKGPY